MVFAISLNPSIIVAEAKRSAIWEFLIRLYSEWHSHLLPYYSRLINLCIKGNKSLRVKVHCSIPSPDFAPSEAEAHCAALCKSGKVYGVASEDMDSLTFGAPKFLRHLMDPSSRKIPVMEFEVAKILEELQLTMDHRMRLL